MNRVDAHLALVHLVERVLKCLDRTLHVSLDNKVELLDLGILHGREEVLERDVLDLVLLLDASLERSLICEGASLTLVRKDAKLVASHGDAREVDHLDGI